MEQRQGREVLSRQRRNKAGIVLEGLFPLYHLKEYIQKTTDYVTLNMIHKHAKDFGIPYCDYDFNNAPITIKVNGVAVKFKPKDVHFIIDEVKGEGAHYNVVLDVRTK